MISKANTNLICIIIEQCLFKIDMDDKTHEKMYFHQNNIFQIMKVCYHLTIIGTVLILVTEMISCFAF